MKYTLMTALLGSAMMLTACGGDKPAETNNSKAATPAAATRHLGAPLAVVDGTPPKSWLGPGRPAAASARWRSAEGIGDGGPQ